MHRRVTVVVPVCVCLSIKSHLTSGVSVCPKILSHTQRVMEIEKFVGFSLKPLCCGDPALPPLKAIRSVGHFPAESVHVQHIRS